MFEESNLVISREIVYKYLALSLFILVLLLVYTLFSGVEIPFLVNSSQANLEDSNTASIENGGYDLGLSSENESSQIIFDLSGAVVNPGVYSLPLGSNFSNAIHKGGGFSKDADMIWVSRKLNLARVVTNNQKIYIPFVWDSQKIDEFEFSIPKVGNSSLYNSSDFSDIAGTSSLMDSENAHEAFFGDDSTSDTLNSKYSTQTIGENAGINLNTASSTEIETLSGIGPKYAERIILGRPYTNFNDLITKSDVPESILRRVEENIVF